MDSAERWEECGSSLAFASSFKESHVQTAKGLTVKRELSVLIAEVRFKTVRN